MASDAKRIFLTVRRKARRLAKIATDQRLRPLTYEDMEPGLHAGFASLVSGWELYVESITLEALAQLRNPSVSAQSTLAQVLHSEATRATEKFNTPNFENSRDLILRFTGFDPFNSMRTARLNLSVQQTQTRLNEILKVRHAFAHALPIPNYSWLSRYGVNSRLTKSALTMTDILLSDLVSSIDKEMALYLTSTFAIPISW